MAKFTDPQGRAFTFTDRGQTDAEIEAAGLTFGLSGRNRPGFDFRPAGGPFPTAPAKDISKPGLFKRGRSAAIKGIGKIPVIGGALSTAVDIVAPETPAGLAVDTLLAAGTLIPPVSPFAAQGLIARRLKTVGKVAAKVGKLVPTAKGRAAVRVGLPPLVGGATAAATGGDISKGVATGAGASVAELVGVPARAASRFSKKITFRPGLIKQGVTDAAALGKQIGREVPVFKKLLTGKRDDLFSLRSQKKGLQALRDQFQATDDAIKEAFKGDLISFPRSEALVGKVTLKGKFTESLTAEKALAKLKSLKKEARKLNSEFVVREEARQFEEGFRKALEAKDPKLLAKFNTAITEFSKGRDILTILKESKALETSPQGGFLNLGTLANFLSSNIERFPPQRFPRLWATAVRGLKPGVADVINELTFRGIVPRAGAANIKLFNVLEKAGRKVIGPGRGQAPASAASSRIFEALSGSPF